MNEQRTEAWYQARLGIPSASRFGDLMARTRSGPSTSRKAYAVELAMERITGKRVESYTNADMQRGIDTEPLARLYYTLKTGNQVEECGFVRHDIITAGASPDGLVGDDGLVEFKVPRPHNHYEVLVTGKVPRQYEWQVIGQMWATGRKWNDFMSFCPEFPEDTKAAIVHVDRDEAKILELEGELVKFEGEIQEIVAFIQNYGRGEHDVNSKSSGEGTQDSDVRVRGSKNGVPAMSAEVGVKYDDSKVGVK